MSVLRILKKGKKNTVSTEEAHIQPLYYTTIDGQATGITAAEVSQAVAGDAKSIKKLYIGLHVGGTVKIKSIDTDKDGNAITGSPYFAAGVNSTPVSEVIQDETNNPTQIDIYY